MYAQMYIIAVLFDVAAERQTFALLKATKAQILIDNICKPIFFKKYAYHIRAFAPL
jgi:hypothetical protein